MQWTVVADILRALAAGLTAVVATLKFIYDIRQKHKKPNTEEVKDDTPPSEETADVKDTDSS